MLDFYKFCKFEIKNVLVNFEILIGDYCTVYLFVFILSTWANCLFYFGLADWLFFFSLFFFLYESIFDNDLSLSNILKNVNLKFLIRTNYCRKSIHKKKIKKKKKTINPRDQSKKTVCPSGQYKNKQVWSYQRSPWQVC